MEYEVTRIDEKSLTITNDPDKNSLMNHILGEKVAISIGNCIFIPALTQVDATPERVVAILDQHGDKLVDTYVPMTITIDDKPVMLMTHISRLLHSQASSSLSVYPIQKLSKEDFCIAFKNEFPPILLSTVAKYAEHQNLSYTTDQLAHISMETPE